MKREFISGCQAAALGAKLARVNVVAAYPITPQTSIVETLADYIADGELEAQMVHVESEHSAMSVSVGAAVVGARVFTATCGQGLAYMQEPLFWAAGLRLPIVMAITNRSLLAPNTIFCDHQDSMSVRDSGWLQFYCESCQEVLDSILIAFKIAQDPSVLLPAMVCLDGFFLSHFYEEVEIPDTKEVDKFLPFTEIHYPTLDPQNPKLLNVFSPPDYYTEFEYDKQFSHKQAEKQLDSIFSEFNDQFGRKYSRVETYELEGAEIILIAMGTMAGTARAVVRSLRKDGLPIGLLKIRTFRPFPAAEIKTLLQNAKVVGVLDRSISFGSNGPLYQEIVGSMYGSNTSPQILDFIVGLGGRDVSSSTIEKVVKKCEAHRIGNDLDMSLTWADVNHERLSKWGLEI